MGAVGLSLLVLGLGAGTHPSWTRRGYAGRVMSPLATARRLEMPLFDPLSDELPFPFPPPPLAPDTPTSHSPPVLRFTFDRPMYRRLMTVRSLIPAQRAAIQTLTRNVSGVTGSAPLAHS
eukprot:scaffold72044_cov27-Tisochrysis_lutea.AAC.1